jgi:catechol 2,3-dioxygenase-like lactoylglutathione lyase family enzyme
MAEPEVSHGEPELLAGTDHAAVSGSDAESTTEFYRDVPGMPLVLRQPNLDRGDLAHPFFDTGDGRLLTFFVSPDREPPGALDPDVGDAHHLAFTVRPGRFDDLKARLTEAGDDDTEFDRGVFHSIYTADPNGLTIEPAVDEHRIPDGRTGEVYALAQEKREAEGAAYVDDRHVEAAKAELGIDTEPVAVGDAPAGRDARAAREARAAHRFGAAGRTGATRRDRDGRREAFHRGGRPGSHADRGRRRRRARGPDPDDPRPDRGTARRPPLARPDRGRGDPGARDRPAAALLLRGDGRGPLTPQV